MQSVAEHPRAFAVWFKDLSRWDASSFHRIKWHWPATVMVPIGEVLRPRRERVDRTSTPFSELQPITIHFDGSIDKRKVEGNRQYSMDLWYARPGDIVVAKIDLKNGAVGIVPADWNNVVVTGHFAVYEPNRSRRVPEYLHRVVQARFFKDYLWRNKVGAEGRKEVKLEFFEAEPIPLPSIAEQRSIVSRWDKAQIEIARARERIEKHKQSMDAVCFTDLGLKVPKRAEMQKAFAVLWTDLLRWGVGFNFLNKSASDLSQGRYPVITLGCLLEVVQYGTSEKANTASEGVPVVRMNNLVDGQVDLTNLKHVRLNQQEVERLALKKGDILFNRTNSKELVGKCAVFHSEGQYVFASYLIRVRVNSTKADPDYLAYIINSRIGRQQINALSRQIIGQANVNSEELRGLQIPLPPLPIQQQIMQRISSARVEIQRENKQATDLARRIEAEVEALILGSQKVRDR